jgi:pyridoxamine 5'-phosphate oxidase
MQEDSDRLLKLSLGDLRENYTCGELDESSVSRNPIEQFELWFAEAAKSGIREANAMTLSTVAPNGQPSARVVLLKEVSCDGFVFFTNYESRKGRELAANPQVALTFFWPTLERQVRVEGTTARVPRSASEQYFRTRPRGSRLGALASKQSSIVQDRIALETKLNELTKQYQGTDDVPMPDYWGGYRVTPHWVEFWQGRPNRLHDRICFEADPDSETGWRIRRLSP